jgi:hypothetical protein
MHVTLNNQSDVFVWSLHKGCFTDHSLYLALIANGTVCTNKQIWRLKVPLKIKNFMWYLRKEVVLTKDNLSKQNWGESKQCSFCLRGETIQHLFFIAFMRDSFGD